MAYFVKEVGSSPVKEGGMALVKTSSSRSKTLTEDTSDDQRVEKNKQFKRAYERIPLVTAIIDVQADQTVQEFFFEGPNEEKLTKFGDKNNLMRFFHRVTKSMLLYGNAYVEIVKKGEEVEEMKVLDPVWMKVYRKPTGDVIGYGQIIQNKEEVLWGTTGDSQENSKFKKHVSKIDDIAHFRYNVLGSEAYGRSVLEPLMTSLFAKVDMEKDLKNVIFKYVAPLIWAKCGNDQFPANQPIIDTIAGTLKDLSSKSEISTTHLVELSVLDFQAKGMDIKTPIDHIEQQIVTGGQVPPILLGRASDSGDKQAEVQLRNFGRHIKSIQRELKYEFEDNIIVKAGIGTEEDKLIWAKADEREWEIDVDIIRGLVTDGVLSPQKANDLLPPRFRETLPKLDLMNQNDSGPGGVQSPRASQGKNTKVKDNPNNPTKTTKDPKSKGRRITKSDKVDKNSSKRAD